MIHEDPINSSFVGVEEADSFNSISNFNLQMRIEMHIARRGKKLKKKFLQLEIHNKERKCLLKIRKDTSTDTEVSQASLYWS